MKGLLDPKTANYLAAVVEVSGKLGLAWVELSTGRFSLTGMMRTELADEIARLNPAETLLSETQLDAPWAKALRGTSWLLDHHAALLGFSGRGGPEHALRPFQNQNPRRLRNRRPRPRSPGRGRLDRLPRRDPENRRSATSPGSSRTEQADVLALDETTRRSLELTRTLREGKREGSLLSVIDRTVTPMGARLLAEWLTRR